MPVERVNAVRDKGGKLIEVGHDSMTIDAWAYNGQVFATEEEARHAQEIGNAEAKLKLSRKNLLDCLEQISSHPGAAEEIIEELFPEWGGRNDRAHDFMGDFKRAAACWDELERLKGATK